MIEKVKQVIGTAVLMLAVSFAGFTHVSAQLAAPNDELVIARIAVKTEADMRRVMGLGLDLMEYREGDDLIFITTRAQIDELGKAGFEVRLDKKLTAELPRTGGETFLGGYRTVEETYAFLDQMHAAYPSLATVFTYGQSWLKIQNPANGYDLKGITLTSAASDRRPKPTFFLQAGIHARELVPPELATRFISYLLTNYGIDADATWLLDEHKIVVIPILNPDGRKIAETGELKRKNMNNTTGGCSIVNSGIDLNRNYSFRWGTINPPTEPPCGQTFPGLTASSEPEISAEQSLILSLFPDQRGVPRTEPAPIDATGTLLDMHSTGNQILYPWGEDTLPPPNPQIGTLARKMAGYNGYSAIQGVELYPTSGSAKDFGYGELGIASMTMEVGVGSGTCGGFMPAYTCLDGGTNGSFWTRNLPVMLYMAKSARTPYMTAEGPTPETVTVTRVPTGGFAVRAQISDQLNGGQIIAGAELYVDTPPWRGGTAVAMTAEDGSFNSMVEFAVGNVNIRTGTHFIYVRGRDANGNWGVVRAVFKTDAT